MINLEGDIMSDKTVNNNGIGFLGLLTIVFVIAKITGYIAWSWFWVFSPILLGIAFVLVVFAIICMIAIIT